MVFTYGATGGLDLPFHYQTGVALNDAQQVLFNLYNQSSGYQATVYSITNGTTTAIPLPKHSSCTSNFGNSLNNEGEVLGETTNCSSSSDYVAWTWTAKGGLKVLSSELPSNTYESIFPRGVNDAGQVLVTLVTQKGIWDWGILTPAK